MMLKLSRRSLRMPFPRIGRRTRAGSRPDGIAAKNRVVLQLNDLGWRSWIYDGSGALRDTPASESFHIADGGQSDRLIRVLERALHSIRERQGTVIDSISLFVDDPAVVFVDNRGAALGTASEDAVRDFGVQLLGRADPAFGSMAFGISSERELERRVYGFIETDRVKKYLAALNELAVKVTGLIPEQLVVLREANAETDQPYISLTFAGAHTTILIANGEFGAVTARTIPIGLYTLVGAVARANRISWDDALQGMTRRDCFSGVALDAPAEPPDGTVPPSVNAEALAAPLAMLVEHVRETLEFFAVQRAGGKPRYLRVRGEAPSLKGFQRWLEAVLELPVRYDDRVPVDLSIEDQRGACLNVLKGTLGHLITIGKVNYRFTEERFWPDPADARKPGARVERGPDRRKVDRGRLIDRRRGDRRAGAKPAEAGLLGGLLPREGMYAAVLVLMLSGAWFAIDENVYTPDRMRFGRAIDAYETVWQQYESLRRKMASGAVRVTAARQRSDNRVLWAERLVHAASHLRPGMWLQSVDLATVVIREHKTAALAKTLSITAGLPSSGGNHVGEIAAFMDALDRDPVFKSNFRKITFEEAAIARGEARKSIEFTVHARTSPNIPGGEERGDSSGIGEVLRSRASDTERLKVISDALRK